MPTGNARAIDCTFEPIVRMTTTYIEGGDMTPEGHYATPVQMAYLVENGKLVGRLPELNISGNFFELLGKDYLGTVHGTPQLKSMLSAVTMDVNKG